MAETALGGNTCKNSLKILPRQQGKTEQARDICLSSPTEKRFSGKKAFSMPFEKFLEEGDYRLKVGQQDGWSPFWKCDWGRLIYGIRWIIYQFSLSCTYRCISCRFRRTSVVLLSYFRAFARACHFLCLKETCHDVAPSACFQKSIFKVSFAIWDKTSKGKLTFILVMSVYQ